MIWVGTSGWQYDSWRGLFYPAAMKKDAWLPHFSERFPTVEVNNSFYRLPEETTFARWRDASADGFIIAVKASRFITHLKRLREPREPLDLLWSRAVALGPKLGPVLFQCPPRFRAEPDRLRAFVAALPAGMRAAFEFRDPSWDTAEVHAILDDAGCALVLADRPGLRTRDVVTGGWSYVRFHQGRPDSPFYERAKLRRWADRIAALPASEVWVYFNNDPEGAAIRDAVTMRSLLQQRGVRLAESARPAA